MQATPFRTSHHGQRMRRAALRLRPVALAGLLALLLSPLFPALTPQPGRAEPLAAGLQRAPAKAGAEPTPTAAGPPRPSVVGSPTPAVVALPARPPVEGSPAEAVAEPANPALAGPPTPAAARSPVPATGGSPTPAGAGEAASAPPEPEPPTPEPRPTRAPLAGRSPDGLALHVLRYVPLIVEISAEVGADPAVLAALMEVELSGEDAVSRAGALGLMQLMPDKLEPGDDPFDPPTNVRRAAQLLRRLSARWNGDLAAVAGSYFGAVDAEGYVTEASDGIATGTEYVTRFAAAYRRWALALEMPVQPVVMRVRPPAGPVVLHTVRPGDSARGLAARYGISLATLTAANQLADSDPLVVGQELRIPTVDGLLHLFEPGESLSQLAEHYGVPASSLLEANDLDGEPAVGTLLVVPGVDPTWTPEPTAAEESRPSRFALIPVVSSPHWLAIRPGRSKYLMSILAPV